MVYCCSSCALSEYNDPKRISAGAYDVVAHSLHDGVIIEQRGILLYTRGTRETKYAGAIIGRDHYNIFSVRKILAVVEGAV